MSAVVQFTLDERILRGVLGSDAAMPTRVCLGRRGYDLEA